MEPRADPRGPTARLGVAVATLLVLLGIVAIASRGGLGGGEASSPHADRVFLDRLFTAFLVLLLVYLPIAVWVYWTERHYLKSELVRRRRKGGRNVLILLLLAAALLVRFRGHLDNLHRLPGMQARPPAHGSHTGARAVPYEPHLDWGVVIVLGVVVFSVLLALVLVGRRRLDQAANDDLDPRERLARALAASLDDLISERDPRRAVIAAYARMERALGAAGVPRLPHEVPFEYVGRALVALDVDERAASRLTTLFERARFSTHEIDEQMRGEAIDAFTAIRDELERAAAA